jgi:hypothetical protein
MLRDTWWWPWWVSSLIDLIVVFGALIVFHLSVGRMRRVVAGLVAVVGLVAAVFAPVVMNDQSDRPMRPEPSMRSGTR